MAYTQLNLVQPIKPFVTSGCASSHVFVPISVTASTAYLPGDIIVITNGLAVVDNVAPPGGNAASSVVGVCVDKFPSTATVVLSNYILVALPYGPFEGTMVNVTGVANYTFASADLDMSAFFPFNQVDIDTGSGTRNVGVIDSGGTTTLTADVCAASVYALSPSQTGGRAVSTIIHPRVIFSFANTPLMASLTA